MSLKSIGIIGSGYMAKGISFLLLSKGFSVNIYSKRSLSDIKSDFQNKIAYYSAPLRYDLTEVFPNITFYDYDHLSSDTSPLFIETTDENIDKKGQVFKILSKENQDSIIATNTSSISLESLSIFVNKPERFIGLHFLNPPHIINFVEIIKIKKTTEETLLYVKNFSKTIGKEYVVVDDVPGAIINRIIFLQINEAFNLVYKHGIDPVDIDNALRKGANLPFGPIKLAEIISIDICINILQNLYERTNNDSYNPSILLKKLIKYNILGNKNNTSVIRGIRKILSP